MPGDIPREQTQAFLDAFARMPQRVLARMVLSGMRHKAKGDDTTNMNSIFPDDYHVPENVLVREWFPQSSILAHDKGSCT